MVGPMSVEGTPSEAGAHEEDDEMISVDDFDLRLFETEGQPAAYRAWALRLAERSDGANDSIRLAQAVHGVDDPSYYRTSNLLRGTTFAAL